MDHTFSPAVAKDVGVIPAVIFNHILFWIRHNEANETNYNDGKFWTYNSNKAFQAQFDYLSKKQIETAIAKLKEAGYIETGNYNKMPFDRTLWFALGPSGIAFDKADKTISASGEIHFPKTGNGDSQNGEPIPDNKPDRLTDNNPPIYSPQGEAANAAVVQEVKKRINYLFNRRETTSWTAKETAQLKAIAKRNGVLDELAEIETLYNSGYKYRRRDIITFLNNFSGELDRARNRQNDNNKGIYQDGHHITTDWNAYAAADNSNPF